MWTSVFIYQADLLYLLLKELNIVNDVVANCFPDAKCLSNYCYVKVTNGFNRCNSDIIKSDRHHMEAVNIDSHDMGNSNYQNCMVHGGNWGEMWFKETGLTVRGFFNARAISSSPFAIVTATIRSYLKWSQIGLPEAYGPRWPPETRHCGLMATRLERDYSHYLSRKSWLQTSCMLSGDTCIATFHQQSDKKHLQGCEILVDACKDNKIRHIRSKYGTPPSPIASSTDSTQLCSEVQVLALPAVSIVI